MMPLVEFLVGLNSSVGLLSIFRSFINDDPNTILEKWNICFGEKPFSAISGQIL